MSTAKEQTQLQGEIPDASTAQNHPSDSEAQSTVIRGSERWPVSSPDASSPGPSVPGSFPPGAESQNPPFGLHDLSSNAHAIVEKAKEIMPGSDEVARAAQSVVQAATQLLPTSISSAVPGLLSTASPSVNEERHGGNGTMQVQDGTGEQTDETVSEVGAIPSTTNNSGAVKGVLASTAAESSASAAEPGPATPVDVAEGAAGTTGIATFAGAAQTLAADKGALDRSYVPRVKPEALVAASVSWPDARNQIQHGLKVSDVQGAPDIPPASALTETNDSGITASNTADVSADTTAHPPSDNAPFKPGSRTPLARDDGVNEARDPGPGNEMAQDSAPKDVHPVDAKASTSAPAIPGDSQGEPNTASKGDNKHKSKFIDRVKGEIKIISGKLGGDKAKVEEGRRLKSGEYHAD